LLWVGKERTIESFQGFFTIIGEPLAARIEFVCRFPAVWSRD
jgi:hypothetical protein